MAYKFEDFVRDAHAARNGQPTSFDKPGTTPVMEKLKHVLLPAPIEAMIIMVRHGDTNLNSDSAGEKIRGWLDVPLNAKGKQQAVAVGQKMADQPIEKIYTSNLSRAEDVAKQIRLGIKKTQGREVTVTPTQNLRPWNLGQFQGQDVEKNRAKIAAYADKTPTEKVPGGEAFNTFLERTLKFVKARMAESEKTHGAVVLVTHTRVLRLVDAWVSSGMDGHKYGKDLVAKADHTPTGGYQLLVKRHGTWVVHNPS